MDCFIDLSVSRFDNTNAVASHLRAFGMAVSLSPSDEKLCVSLFTEPNERESTARTSFFLDADHRDYTRLDWTVGAQPKNTSAFVVLPDAYHVIKDANNISIVDTFLDDLRQDAAMKVRNRTKSLQEQTTPPRHKSLYRLGSAPFAFLDYSAVSFQGPLVEPNFRNAELLFGARDAPPKTFAAPFSKLEESAHFSNMDALGEWLGRADPLSLKSSVAGFDVSTNYVVVYESAVSQVIKRAAFPTVESACAHSLGGSETELNAGSGKTELGSHAVRQPGLFARVASDFINAEQMKSLVAAAESNLDTDNLFRFFEYPTNTGISRNEIGTRPDQRTVHRLVTTGGAFSVQFEFALDLAQQIGLSRIDAIPKRIAEELNSRISSHLYVKGPSGSAFGVHADDTDTFVYQLAGCNEWMVCTPHHNKSTDEAHLSDSERSERFLLKQQTQMFRGQWTDLVGTNDIEEQAACSSHVMKPGDAQYLPRAIFHFAKATPCAGPSGGEKVAGLPPGSSVHLTVGVHRERSEWVHLLEISKDILEASQSQLHGQDERNKITSYAHSLPPWRRQMPTWTLRDGPDEVLEEWRSKLKLLWQHVEIEMPRLATNSSLTWLLSLHDRTALHAAILAWQPLEERELGAGGASNGQRRLGSTNFCYINEDCPAGYYGPNNAGDWTSNGYYRWNSYCNAGCDASYGDHYCDDSCDYCWGCSV